MSSGARDPGNGAGRRHDGDVEKILRRFGQTGPWFDPEPHLEALHAKLDALDSADVASPGAASPDVTSPDVASPDVASPDIVRTRSEIAAPPLAEEGAPSRRDRRTRVRVTAAIVLLAASLLACFVLFSDRRPLAPEMNLSLSRHRDVLRGPAQAKFPKGSYVYLFGEADRPGLAFVAGLDARGNFVPLSENPQRVEPGSNKLDGFLLEGPIGPRACIVISSASIKEPDEFKAIIDRANVAAAPLREGSFEAVLEAVLRSLSTEPRIRVAYVSFELED